MKDWSPCPSHLPGALVRWALPEMGSARTALGGCACIGTELILRKEVMLEGPSQLCQCLEKCVFGRGISVLGQVRLVFTSLSNDAPAGMT